MEASSTGFFVKGIPIMSDDGRNSSAHRVSPEEIAKLWMSENAIVNQKTAYFIAATAFLVGAIAQASVSQAGTVYMAVCGLGLSILTFLSIARTCTYREHLRRELEGRSPDYARLLQPSFSYFDGFRSTGVLKAMPLLGLLAWGIFLTWKLGKVMNV